MIVSKEFYHSTMAPYSLKASFVLYSRIGLEKESFPFMSWTTTKQDGLVTKASLMKHK